MVIRLYTPSLRNFCDSEWRGFNSRRSGLIKFRQVWNVLRDQQAVQQFEETCWACWRAAVVATSSLLIVIPFSPSFRMSRMTLSVEFWRDLYSYIAGDRNCGK